MFKVIKFIDYQVSIRSLDERDIPAHDDAPWRI